MDQNTITMGDKDSSKLKHVNITESTPIKVNEQKISSYFKTLDTTPAMSEKGRSSKRKVISPIEEQNAKDSTIEIDEDQVAMNITTKLDAFKETFDSYMKVVFQKIKEQISEELDQFKKDIMQVLDKKEMQQKERVDITNTVKDIEKAQQYQTGEIEDLRNEHMLLLKKCQLQEGQLVKNEKDIEFLKEEVLQIQAGSMRDNLVYNNIEELAVETSEKTKDILINFMKKKLKIPDRLLQDITFDRVHRMGQKQHRPRPIVTKFNPYRGKELVLQHTKNLDKAKRFIISDQLPNKFAAKKTKTHATVSGCQE